MHKTQLALIQAAQIIFDNCTAGETAQCPTEFVENGLGAALVAVSEWEQKNGGNRDFSIEHKLRAANELYCKFFDQCVIPGVRYRSLPIAQVGPVRYICKSDLDRLRADFLGQGAPE